MGLLIAAWLAPLVPIHPTTSTAHALVAYAVAYGCVAACALIVAASTPDVGRVAFAVVVIAGVLLAWLGSSASLAHVAIVLVCLLAGGTSAGAAIGARIEHAGHLLPVAIVSALADAFSVWTPGAPSNAVLEAPALLSVLAIGWPMLGTHDLPAILGVGDVVFVALYFAAARAHALSITRTTLALIAALAATAITVIATSTAIPALPFMGAAVVIAHPEARRVPVEDRRAAALVTVVLVLALAARLFVRSTE